MNLRDYQRDIVDQVATATTHDCIRLDTGAGKTAIMAALAKDRPSLCIAHRNVLIEQIGLALALCELPHWILAPRHTVAQCAQRQRQELERHWLDPHSQTVVASLDSLLSWHKRGKLTLDTAAPWLIHIDEAHHCTETNKWGRLREIFPNARFIGYTATPCRLDGQSLHSADGGLFDRLVEAEGLQDNSCETLIQRGFLAPYIAYGIPSDLPWGLLRKGRGDWTSASLAEAIGCSHIVNDFMGQHRRFADGKQTLVFTAGIGNADALADAINMEGVSNEDVLKSWVWDRRENRRAAVIHSQLSASENARRIDLFRRKKIRFLISVDMVGEGFDVPGIECVQICRPTQSLGLHRQMIGRALRPLPGKERAIIIDHVGNLLRLGLPDDPIHWDLREPPPQQPAVQIICPACSAVTRAYLDRCPECGEKLRFKIDPECVESFREFYGIDWALVELKRSQIDKERRDAEQRQRLQNEYVPPVRGYSYGTAGGMMAATLDKMLDWYCRSLIAQGIPAADVNMISQGQLPDKSWWMRHFTVNDMKNDNRAKALRVYRSTAA